MAVIRQRHLNLARDRRAADHLPELRRGMDPERALAIGEAHIRQLGLVVVRTGDERPARSIGRLLFLPRRFDAAPIVRRVGWQRHELTHAWQWRTWGRVLFVGRYAFAGLRWGCEMQCDIEAITTMQTLGARQYELRSFADDRAAAYAGDGYAMGRLDRSDLMQHTRRELLAAVGLRV